MASTYLSLYLHVVFATARRAPMVTEDWRPEFWAYLSGTARSLGAEIAIVGGTADHVHLLLRLRATTSVADLVRELKKQGTKWAREKFVGFGWQEGYAALSLGAADAPRIAAYIERQEEHHRKVTPQEELRALLAEAGVEIDERFFE